MLYWRGAELKIYNIPILAAISFTLIQCSGPNTIPILTQNAISNLTQNDWSRIPTKSISQGQPYGEPEVNSSALHFAEIVEYETGDLSIHFTFQNPFDFPICIYTPEIEANYGAVDLKRADTGGDWRTSLNTGLNAPPVMRLDIKHAGVKIYMTVVEPGEVLNIEKIISRETLMPVPASFSEFDGPFELSLTIPRATYCEARWVRQPITVRQHSNLLFFSNYTFVSSNNPTIQIP